jgi:hypothetical protein
VCEVREVVGRDLGGGSDGEGLVDAAEGHSIDLVRASHEEQTGRELLQEHHPLSPEATGEEDEHGAGGDGGAQLGGLSDVAAREGHGDVLGGIEARRNLLRTMRVQA